MRREPLSEMLRAQLQAQDASRDDLAAGIPLRVCRLTAKGLRTGTKAARGLAGLKLLQDCERAIHFPP